VIAGIILAAGASTRMGSPKALLDYLRTPEATAVLKAKGLTPG